MALEESPARAEAQEAGHTCAICQTQIIRGEWITPCPACQLLYHLECWRENGGCAQYGCQSAPQVEKEGDVQFGSNVWGEEKSCPQCNRKIKASAIKCRFCGATFDTRDYVSRSEYARREYREKEYAFARAAMIALFLMSVTGCLSPFALLLHLILRFGGSLGAKLQFVRLPEELKALNLAGLLVSAALTSAGVLAILMQIAGSL